MFEMRLTRRAHRHPNARGHAAVGVDDEIDGCAAEASRIGIEGGVLQPDSWVEELRLVSTHDNRTRDPVGDIGGPVYVAVAGRVFGGDGEHLSPSRGHELPQL